MGHLAEHGDDSGPADRGGHSVGDPVLRKSRVLPRPCDTCVFYRGNMMTLAPGRLRDLVDRTRAEGTFIFCHDTLSYGRFPHARPAICRGFLDRYDTQALQLIRRLWGFVEVDPPTGDGDGGTRPAHQ